MGQKVHPGSFRLGSKLLNKSNLTSYVGKNSNSKQDIENYLQINQYISKCYSKADISKILVKISNSRFIVDIFCKKPGLIIGSHGSEIEKLKSYIASVIQDHQIPVVINVIEIKFSETDATLVAKSVASQLENRGSFRKIMKKAINHAMKNGAKGIKIACSGRLSGADIARTEKYMEGTIPLHTLRANVQYALAEAKTSYGIIGVKVWIHVNEVEHKTKKTAMFDKRIRKEKASGTEHKKTNTEKS